MIARSFIIGPSIFKRHSGDDKDLIGMRWLTVVYAVLLIVDLLLGSALIVWKCAYSESSLECKLAIGGTLSSLAVWLMLLLVCPVCAVSCHFQEAWEKTNGKLKSVLYKLRPKRSHQVYIQSEIYLPTTLSMRGPRDKVACDVNIMTSQASEDKSAHPLMTPRIEDVVPIPAVMYTFNEANRCHSGSSSAVTCLEVDEP